MASGPIVLRLACQKPIPISFSKAKVDASLRLMGGNRDAGSLETRLGRQGQADAKNHLCRFRSRHAGYTRSGAGAFRWILTEWYSVKIAAGALSATGGISSRFGVRSLVGPAGRRRAIAEFRSSWTERTDRCTSRVWPRRCAGLQQRERPRAVAGLERAARRSSARFSELLSRGRQRRSSRLGHPGASRDPGDGVGHLAAGRLESSFGSSSSGCRRRYPFALL